MADSDDSTENERKERLRAETRKIMEGSICKGVHCIRESDSEEVRAEFERQSITQDEIERATQLQGGKLRLN